MKQDLKHSPTISQDRHQTFFSHTVDTEWGTRTHWKWQMNHEFFCIFVVFLILGLHGQDMILDLWTDGVGGFNGARMARGRSIGD